MNNSNFIEIDNQLQLETAKEFIMRSELEFSSEMVQEQQDIMINNLCEMLEKNEEEKRKKIYTSFGIGVGVITVGTLAWLGYKLTRDN